jgi:energy-coupling factor transport system permease protein
MRLFTPLSADPAAPLARANPMAKLAGALILMAALFVSVDPLTPAIIVAALLAALPLGGLPPATLLARGWLIIVAALTVGIVNTVFAGEQAGPTLVELGPVSIGSETAATGGALGLRIGGIALAGLLAAATTEPSDLADSLVQQMRVSPRFAVGALAAFRLLPVLMGEWQTIGLARRARGLDAGRSPVAAVRLLFGRLLALLVASIRRAARLALAMEARGFGARDCRTAARPMRMGPSDWAWIGAALLVGVTAVAMSAAVGAWRFLLS